MFHVIFQLITWWGWGGREKNKNLTVHFNRNYRSKTVESKILMCVWGGTSYEILICENSVFVGGGVKNGENNDKHTSCPACE